MPKLYDRPTHLDNSPKTISDAYLEELTRRVSQNSNTDETLRRFARFRRQVWWHWLTPRQPSLELAYQNNDEDYQPVTPKKVRTIKVKYNHIGRMMPPAYKSEVDD